jgi:hypothetical protein
MALSAWPSNASWIVHVPSGFGQLEDFVTLGHAVLPTQASPKPKLHFFRFEPAER